MLVLKIVLDQHLSQKKKDFIYFIHKNFLCNIKYLINMPHMKKYVWTGWVKFNITLR